MFFQNNKSVIYSTYTCFFWLIFFLIYFDSKFECFPQQTELAVLTRCCANNCNLIEVNLPIFAEYARRIYMYLCARMRGWVYAVKYMQLTSLLLSQFLVPKTARRTAALNLLLFLSKLLFLFVVC